MCTSFSFGFEDGTWDLIVLIPDHCLCVYFPLPRLSFGLLLKVVDPTLLLSEKTIKESGLVCFKKQLGLLVTGSAW